MHILQFIISGALCAFAIFIFKFSKARMAVLRLKRTGLPMPEFSLRTGHFLAVRETIQNLPSNVMLHQVMWQLSKRFPSGMFYINMWPFSGTWLVVTTPSGAAQIQAANLAKPPVLSGPLVKLNGGPSLLTMHGDIWKRWRTLFNPGFSPAYIMGLAPAVTQEVAVFCDLLRQRVREGRVFQLEDMTLKLTVDTIGAATLDTRLRHQTQDSFLASALQKQIEWTSFGTTYNPIKRYLTIRPFVLWYNSRKMNQFIGQEIDKRYAEHMQQGPDTKPSSRSVMSIVLSQYLAEEEAKQGSGRAGASLEMFKKLVAPQLRLFLFAGRDTTSSTLLYVYYLLVMHPEALGRVRKEHETVFGADCSKARELIEQDPQRLNQLTYTMACIKEVLRLFPPLSALRQGQAGLDLFDDEGRRYPTEGCNVWSLTVAIQRNTNYWPEANSFIPERWLVGPEDPLYPPKGGWRPFEFGSAGCIGQTLALMELRIALVMTLREFDITPAYKEWDSMYPASGHRHVEGYRAYHAEKGGGGAHPADGMPVRVTLRQ
ncbi:putative Cytochrome P450 [Seiridium unicorne]|uniref:Cytochrome P450 n=1 Tax=Seiridium unicorne TaxID=138068 RepID=A0ABR2VK09_9PEZI